MERNTLLAPLFFFTRIGLSILYLLREIRYGFPDRSKIEGTDLPITTKHGTLSLARPLPSHRYESNAASIGDDIYVAGGIFQPSVWLPSDAFEVYHKKTDTWETLTPIPHVVHHTGVVSDGMYIYVVGGDGLRIQALSYVWRYDPKNKLWERLADMPTKRGALGVAYVHGSIYAIGGADNDKKYTIVERYDTKTNTWHRAKSMPTAREHLAVAVTNGKIHALGGYNTDRFGSLTTHEIYDPKNDTWSTSTPLPMRLCGFAAHGLGDNAYVFGGEQGWAITPTVFSYNTKTKVWMRLEDLSVARYAAACAAIENSIHIIGGNTLMFSNNFSRVHEVLTVKE